MGFNAALQGGDYTNLRGDYAGHQLVGLCPNTNIMACRINQASFSDDGFAQLTYHGDTGDYTDAEVGMTVLVSKTNDRRAAYWAGRVRAAPSSTVLYINETAANFEDNDYVWVIDDYRFHRKEARPDGSGGQYKDYDDTYAGLGPVLTDLTVNGVSSLVAAAVADPSTDVASLAFVATAMACEDGASIASYTYTVPSGMSVTAGDAATASVTVDADPGWYWLKLTIVDSGARARVFRIRVFVAAADYSNVAAGFDGAQIQADVDNGYSATVNAFEGVDSVLDNTAIVIFEVNADGGNVAGNVKFSGRLRREANSSEPDEVTSRLREVSFTLEGTAEQLSRLKVQPITLELDTSPSAFDQVDQLTYWRAAVYFLQWHTTVLELCSLRFSDTSDDSLFLNWGIGGEDALTELNGIADDWMASFESAQDGRCQIVQRATALDDEDPANDVDRDALTTVANYTNADGLRYRLNRDHVPQVGLVKGGGGSYQTASGKTPEYLTKAPGIVRGEGPDDHDLTGQVLPANLDAAAAKVEMNRRAGHSLAEQNPADELEVLHPDGYDYMVPSREQWYTWTLDEDDLDIRGVSFDTSTRWLLVNISYGQNNDEGNKTDGVLATYRIETRGPAGETQPPPAPSEGVVVTPIIPPSQPYPYFPAPIDPILPDDPDDGDAPPFWVPTPPSVDPVPIDGNALILASEGHVWATQNFLLKAAPNCNDITPELDVGWYITDYGPKAMGQIKDFYVLASNGSNSKTYYTANPFAALVEWVEGEEIAGEFDAIEVASTAGTIFIYKATTGGEAYEVNEDFWFSRAYPFDFTFDGTPNAEMKVDLDVHAGAVGIITEYTYSHAGGNPIRYNGVLTNSVLVGNGQATVTGTPVLRCFVDGTTSAAYTLLTSTLGYTKVNEFDQQNIVDPGDAPTAGFYDGGNGNQITGFFRVLIESATEPFPGGGGGGDDEALVAFSTDYGVTMSTPEDLGAAPGAFGGLATIPIGDLTLAAYATQVVETDDEGNTSDYGDPMPTGAEAHALLIPRYEFGSSTVSNANATPEYLVASAFLTAGNAALWKVTDTGATFTDITPDDGGGNYGVAESHRCLAMPWRSGSIIAAVLLFDTLPYIAVSTDAGSTWTLRGPLSADGAMVTFRKGDATMQQLFGADGQPFASPNRGATLKYKLYPADDTEEPLIGVAVYG